MKEFFDAYQDFTKTTAVYPEVGTKSKLELCYLFLGLMGEYQEWEEEHDLKEAGDVFWYLSQICTYFDKSLYDLYYSTNFPFYEPSNAFESVKKFIRDNKDPFNGVWDKMVSIIDKIMYSYYYSINNPPIEETVKEIMELNMSKLKDRKERGKLQGDGDNR